MRVDDVLARLDGVSGDAPQWHARCPAHDDHQASLTIAVGRDERVLLTCWAGCELESIVGAVGLTVSDLFASQSERALGARHGFNGRALARALRPGLPDQAELTRRAEQLQRSKTTLEAIFELKGWRAGALGALEIGLQGDRLSIPVRHPVTGELVNVLRYWPTAQPKMLALRGHGRAPLASMLDDTAPVWIVEGETDAVSMTMLGLNVLGAPGASAKARVEWLDGVKGRDVLVCFDVDDAGRRAAVKWAAAAHQAGASSVKIVELEGPKGYDVGEVVLEHRDDPGEARRLLYERAQRADEWKPAKPVETIDEPPELATEAIAALEPGTIIVRPLGSFRVRRLRMLWRARIPTGRVGIIYGPPGQGKSTLLALMAADVTQRGGRVMIASAEDEPETTLLPRMVAAGADVGLVDVLSTKASDGETTLVLPRDNRMLGARMSDTAMLVIDPLSSHLGDDINSWKEQDVRSRVLAPLAHFANLTGCSVPLVMHTNRGNSTDALARISGSGGFGGAARFVLLLGEHPDDIWRSELERRLVLVHVKASESAKQPAMVFRRALQGVQTDEGVAVVPTLELVEETTISADAVLEQTSVEDASSYGEAVEFLRNELVDGPKLAKQLLRTARERGDFSERTLRKAKRALRVQSTRDTEGWWWARA